MTDQLTRRKQSMAELLDETPPERVRLPYAGIAGLTSDRGVDHDEAAGRIDVNRLATDAAERKHPPLARQYPDLITVAAGTGLRLARAHTRRILEPVSGNDLPAAPVPIVREQQSQACVVAQHRVDAAVSDFLA